MPGPTQADYDALQALLDDFIAKTDLVAAGLTAHIGRLQIMGVQIVKVARKKGETIRVNEAMDVKDQLDRAQTMLLETLARAQEIAVGVLTI